MKSLRKQSGLSQQELSEKTGVSLSSIHQYEIGRRIPNKYNCNKLAEFFGVSELFILGESEYTTPINEYLENNPDLKQWLLEMDAFWKFASFSGMKPNDYTEEEQTKIEVTIKTLMLLMRDTIFTRKETNT